MDLAKYKSRLWSLFCHLRVGSVPQNLDHICQSLSATKLRINTPHKIFRHWTKETQNISTDHGPVLAAGDDHLEHSDGGAPLALPVLGIRVEPLEHIKSLITLSRYIVISSRGQRILFSGGRSLGENTATGDSAGKIEVCHWAHWSGGLCSISRKWSWSP